MEDIAIPYELPEVENHSFFFIDQRVEPSLEANCTDTMRGNCITWFAGRVIGWRAIRCNRLQRATWR